MEDFLVILKRKPAMPDGTEPLRIPSSSGNGSGKDQVGTSRASHSAVANGVVRKRSASSNSNVAARDVLDASAAAERTASHSNGTGMAESSGHEESWGRSSDDTDWTGDAGTQSEQRPQGLAVEFEHVAFGYSDDRTVRLHPQ